MKLNKWAVALVLALVLCMIGSVAMAVTFTVTDLASLQSALNTATNNDCIELQTTIVVPAGTTIDGKNLTIVPASGFAADGNGAALVCMGNNSSYDASNSYTLKNLGFSGFENLSRIIRANFSNITIENCTFDNNTVSNGVITSAFAKLTVKNCHFEDNSAGIAIVDIGWDVHTSFDPAADISNNTFSGNDADISTIYVLTPGDITDNSFTGNKAGISVIFTENNSDITGNYFNNNAHTGDNANGAAILAGPYKTGSYTINITDNAFENAISGKNGSALPAVYVEDFSEEYSANTSFDLSNNYWNGGSPVYDTTNNPNLRVNGYYNTLSIDANGNMVLSNTAPEAPSMPRTGDNSHVLLWAGLMLVSVLGMVTFEKKRAAER